MASRRQPERLRLRAERDLARREVCFYLVDPDDPPEPAVVPDPDFTIDTEAIPALMEDLWRAGFRPKSAETKDGELAAKEKNLEDLRNTLDRVLPSALREKEVDQ